VSFGSSPAGRQTTPSAREPNSTSAPTANRSRKWWKLWRDRFDLQRWFLANTGWQKIGVKRITPKTTPTPDKTGSRAARTAQFAAMLIAWRKRNSLSRRAAARLLCCTPATIGRWERAQALPSGAMSGYMWTAIVAMMKGGAR
jgi:DNA-binding transcriptional regulator YiaG